MTTITQKNRHIAQVLGTAPPDMLQNMLDAGLPISYIAASLGTTTRTLTDLLNGPDPFPTPKPTNWAGLIPGVGGTYDHNSCAPRFVGVATVFYAGPQGGYTYGPAEW